MPQESRNSKTCCYFYVINMKKNPDRYKKISSTLSKIGCHYERIEAVDGFKIEEDKEALSILKYREELHYRHFECSTFSQKWKYDGTIMNSFPGLNLYGHQGAKGLILSNMKAFERAINNTNYSWYCILEDDASINNEIYQKILLFLEKNKDVDILLLDTRAEGWGGTAGIIYNKKILSRIIEDLHPLSDFSINMEKNYGQATLWDWKLWRYIKNADSPKINYRTLPCIKSGFFGSTIN